MSLFAVVPVKDLRQAKSRLEPILDPACRAGLTLYMMGRVISVLREAEVEKVCVVSPDPVVLEQAREKGAFALLQEGRGLNPALDQGRRWAMDRDAAALLVLPADLPLLEAEDVRSVLDGGGKTHSSVISPDATRAGTNALLMRPPDAIPFAFGPGSFEAHRRAAEERGIPLAVVERPHLSFDLDTDEDLSRLGTSECQP